MKALQIFKVALVVLFLTAGLIGCASTQPAQDPAVGNTDMSQQGDAQGTGAGAGAGSDSMKEEVVPTHDHMAGMGNVYFDFDQFTLSADARDILANNAKYLKMNDAVQVVIEGHCDERGSDEYNLALGESRAIAAKNYLVSLGVNAKRLSVISYGEEKPAVKGSGESAWAKNRRAEFKAVK